MNAVGGSKGGQVENLLGRFWMRGLVPILVLLFVGLVFQGAAALAALTHPFDQALSHEGTFERPCGVATDSEGDLYGGRIGEPYV
jgi:hypothetical protein